MDSENEKNRNGCIEQLNEKEFDLLTRPEQKEKGLNKLLKTQGHYPNLIS